MRFFTPELYLRFNSADEDVADAANEDWENAASEYREHLDRVRDQMPSQVRKLAERSLHDAELLAWDQEIEPVFPVANESSQRLPIWSAVAFVSLIKDGRLFSLIYLLWDRIRESDSKVNWPFSKLHPHWLYDEVDVIPGQRGTFLHRILLSDGRVLEIPFVSAFTHQLPLTREVHERQLAGEPLSL